MRAFVYDLPETTHTDPVERMRLELGTPPDELLAERLEGARTELMEALKLADRHGLSEAHVNVGQIVLAVDDERIRLAGKS